MAERNRIELCGTWLLSSAPNRAAGETADAGGKAATGTACYSGKV